MKTTERLKALAEKATPYWEGPINDLVADFIDEINPATIKELCELVEMMEGSLTSAKDLITYQYTGSSEAMTALQLSDNAVCEALTRVAKFQKGE